MRWVRCCQPPAASAPPPSPSPTAETSRAHPGIRDLVRCSTAIGEMHSAHPHAAANATDAAQSGNFQSSVKEHWVNRMERSEHEPDPFGIGLKIPTLVDAPQHPSDDFRDHLVI